MNLSVIASITDPGHPDRENEDRLGWNETCTFVIDGATSLAGPIVRPPRSDAAWLAEHAAGHFRSRLTSERCTASVVRELNRQAAIRFEEACRVQEVERFRHPTAGFTVLRVFDGRIEVVGLCDCVLFLRDAAGTLVRWSAIAVKRSREQYFARKALIRSGGFDGGGSAYREHEVLTDLRARRALHNVAGGPVWTLGLEPDAADHLVISNLDISLPATGVLCTDGFGDLIDAYARYTIDGLIERAETAGLPSLIEELRHIERHVDPNGDLFPRFKQCDDASAVLLRLES
jgi:hypothetical protein